MLELPEMWKHHVVNVKLLLVGRDELNMVD